MATTFLPELVNGPGGDPALFVAMRHARRALLVDLGEIPALVPRKLLAIRYVLVSHAHMDHFAGFDRLLRVALGRDLTLELFGPEGFADRVGHKLGGYTWNLVAGYTNDFRLVVTEVPEHGRGRRVRFRVGTGFAPEELTPGPAGAEPLVDEPGLRVRTAVLDHGTPCLAFALEEPEHLDVWPDRLRDRGLAPGDWLQTLKDLVRRGAPGDHPVPVAWQDPEGRPPTLPLGELVPAILGRSRGHKIAYVVDSLYSEANARRIVDLAKGADRLYIEAAFAQADAERAAATRHLTARQAGQLARRAGVGEMVPFHFSGRYAGRTDALEAEARAAFRAER